MVRSSVVGPSIFELVSSGRAQFLEGPLQLLPRTTPPPHETFSLTATVSSPMVSQLFRSAEAGDVEKVREILKESSSIDIETKDHTGATPLICAVKNGHTEVVKELLAAGADALNPSSHGPPSSHTSDPELLSLLSMAVRPPPGHPLHQQYNPAFNPHHQPPPPPQFQDMYPPMDMQAQQGGYPNYYPPGMFMPQFGMPYPPPPPGQYPHPSQHHQQQMQMHHQQEMHHHHQQHQQQQQPQPQQQVLPGEDKPAEEGGVQGENGTGTIPPPDVSKMIPCKFFPDCRYGAQCAFLHPPQPTFSPPPHAPPPSAMYPQHFHNGPEHFPHPYYPMAPPPFGYQQGPGGPQGMRPPPPHGMAQQQQQPYPFQRHQPPPHLVDYNNENAFIVVPPPFQAPPNFSPSALATPFAPSPSAGGPQSSSPSPPLPTATSPAPAEESTPSAEDDASSPAGEVEIEPAAAVEPVAQQPSAQREFAPQQQQQQQPFVRRPNQFGPGAGFPKKWIAGAKKWTGGSPPPCIYYARNLCRNGDICRFPHLRADGSDTRLPGIIDGSLAPAPVSHMNSKPVPASNAARHAASSSMSAPLDSSLESLSTSDLTSSLPTLEDTPTGPRYIPSASTPAFVPSAPAPAPVRAAHPNPNHLSNQPFHPSNLNRPMMFPNHHHQQNQQPRSAPTTRPVSPSAGGFAGRSASVQPPRRKEEGGSTASAAAAAAAKQQRVPSSEDFPALGGGGGVSSSTGSLGGSAVLVGGGKTAAQVLSGPAPVIVKATTKQQQQKKAAATTPAVQEEEDAKSMSSAEHVQAASDTSEDDAVLVASSAKTAPSAPNGGAATPTQSSAMMPVKKGPVAMSFAGAAGALVGAKA